MTLLQLEYFLAAAKHGSFSGAADELHLTQPGVSEQVRRLEAELGIPLFNRVGRGVVLTSAGRAFLPRAEEVVGAAARASESMAKLRSMRGGQITFGLFRNADYSILPALCSDFHARHPDVRLRLVGQNSGETAEEVRSGRLDAALVGGPIDPNGLDVVPVVRDEVLYVTAAPERGDRPVTIEELVVRPLILYDAQYAWRDTTRRQLERRAQAAGATLEPIFDVEHIEGALQMAAMGLGDTLATETVTMSQNFPENLFSVPFAEPLVDDYLFIARKGAPITAPIRELAELATRHLHRIMDRPSEAREAS